MKRIISFALCVSLCCAALSAGDVATFVDKGFSEDGKYYVFGQYGRTDKKYQGWAEIYQVDIAKNDWVDGGVFKINPTAVTADKAGVEVYEALEGKNYYYLRDLKCKVADADRVLYILDDVNKTGTDEIVFTDFNNSTVDSPNTFHIQLVPTINGKGKSVKSSFYIWVEKKDAEGNTISKTKVGSPEVVRSGISNYKIERIMCDPSQTNFIFVIEKIQEDDTGISIRYMVEAAKIK
ncbi:MAG: DUF2259 domain-containing protein [Treponema sp.]|nr:DUF2259 domain-containing protein [Treponema sp.]